MGQRILQGEVPYRDIFDHKTPGVYYVYAFLLKYFGQGINTIRIFTLFYSMLTTLGLYLLGRRLWGTWPGIIAALWFALFSGGPAIQGSNANAEVFMILPLIWALYFFISAQKQKTTLSYFWAGLFSGLAILIKQSAAFNLLVLLGFVFWEGWSAVFMLALGACVFPLFFTVYFIWQGAFTQFISCAVLANVTYLKASPVPAFWAYPWYGLSIISEVFLYENSILWILAAAALVYMWFEDRNRESGLLAAWAFFSFAGVASAQLFFRHYFIQLLPALVLLSTYALIKLPAKIKLALTGLFLILLVPVFKEELPYYFKYSPDQISEKKFGSIFWGKSAAVASDLKKTIKTQDDLFVWDSHPEIYFYLNKKAPSYYAYYLNWMGEGPKQEIFREVLKRPPRYILWVSHLNFDKTLMDFIKREYKLRRKYVIYQNLTWGLFERSARL